MKKTIEQQIAELTSEQKNSMKKIYRKYLISFFSVILVGVILIVGIYLYAAEPAKEAKAKYDELSEQIDILSDDDWNLDASREMFELMEKRGEYFDEYHDMKRLKSSSLGIGGGVGFIGLLVVILIFKKKYPYFSEKKYLYMKKSGALSTPVADYTLCPNCGNSVSTDKPFCSRCGSSIQK